MGLLEELAVRCETATGFDRDLGRNLDRDIAIAAFDLTADKSVSDWWLLKTKAGRHINWMGGDSFGPRKVEESDMSACTGWTVFDVPPFTASMDAAIALVPEGARWGFEWEGADSVWAEVSVPLSEGWWSDDGRVFAATPALALTAASLRARHALALSKGSEG